MLVKCTNLLLPFILWHQADAFFTSCRAHKQFYFYDHTLKIPSLDSSWPRDQFLIKKNWDKLFLFPFFQNIYHSEATEGCQSPQQVAWRRMWRSIQVLTTYFCCLAIENAKPSARYTSTLIKTILSYLFSPGKIWQTLMRFHI